LRPSRNRPAANIGGCPSVHFRNPFNLSHCMTARCAIHAAGRSSASPALIRAFRASGLSRMLKAMLLGAGFVASFAAGFFIVASCILVYTQVYCKHAYHNQAEISSFGPRIPLRWPGRAAPGGSRVADLAPFPIARSSRHQSRHLMPSEID
jgi:hypothetical protein